MIEYLDARPIACTTDPMAEYLHLIDDVYQRGFLEKEDVQTAIAWVNELGRYGPGVTLTDRQDEVTPPPRKNKAAAVVHITSGHTQIVPTWVAIHGPQFENIYIYSPPSPDHSPMISGIPIRDILESAAYVSIVDAIEHFLRRPTDPSIEGLIFIRDDVIWQANATLDGAASYCIGCFKSHPASKAPHQLDGSQAVDAMLGKQLEYYASMGQADEFYMAVNDLKTFVDIGRKMVKAGLDLKISTQTNLASFLNRSQPRTVPVFTYVNLPQINKGQDYKASTHEFCGTKHGHGFFHPYNLSHMEGISAHLECTS